MINWKKNCTWHDNNNDNYGRKDDPLEEKIARLMIIIVIIIIIMITNRWYMHNPADVKDSKGVIIVGKMIDWKKSHGE